MKIFHKGIYVEYIHKIETLSKAHSNNVKSSWMHLNLTFKAFTESKGIKCACKFKGCWEFHI